MLSYKKFNLDRILESLVNESMFYYTNAFADLLKKIKNNEIAEELLKLKGTDVKPDMTFIDIDDKEGFITFSQINKAISGINKWGDEYIDNNVEVDGEEVKASLGRVIDTIKDGTFKGTFKGDLYTKSRNSVKLGKLVNSIFPGKYKASEVEEFVNKYKSKSINEKDFDLVSGEDLRHWYNEENYSEDSGSIGSSCMRYSRCQRYLDIYVDNKDVCQLLILKDNDDDTKILGRALVWKFSDISADAINEGMVEYYMDRIYVCEDIYYEDFKDYAESQNWCYRSTQGYGLSDVRYKGERHNYVRVEIQLDYYNFDRFPYMDTFKRLSTGDGVLYNDDENEDGCYILEDTGGGFREYGNWSNYYDCTIPEDESVWSEKLDDYLWADQAVHVDSGYWGNHGYYPDDYHAIVYDEYREEYIHNDDAIYCDYEDSYFLDNDAVDCITEFTSLTDYSEEAFSDNCNKIINVNKMATKDYLENNDFSIEYFHKDLLGYSNNEYYLLAHSVEVFNTGNGFYSAIDCDILGIDVSKNSSSSYLTDEFAYNQMLQDNEEIETLKKKCLDKIKYYKSDVSDDILPGTQTKLRFDGDNDQDFRALVNEKIVKLENRYDELESFL